MAALAFIRSAAPVIACLITQPGQFPTQNNRGCHRSKEASGWRCRCYGMSAGSHRDVPVKASRQMPLLWRLQKRVDSINDDILAAAMSLATVRVQPGGPAGAQEPGCRRLGGRNPGQDHCLGEWRSGMVSAKGVSSVGAGRPVRAGPFGCFSCDGQRHCSLQKKRRPALPAARAWEATVYTRRVLTPRGITQTGLAYLARGGFRKGNG